MISAAALVCAGLWLGGCATTNEAAGAKPAGGPARTASYMPRSERLPGAAAYWAQRDLEDRIESEIERRSAPR